MPAVAVPAGPFDFLIELAPLVVAPTIAPAARLFAFGCCCLPLRVTSCGFPLPTGAGVAASALAEGCLPLIRADASVPAAAFAKALVSCRTLGGCTRP